VLFGNQLDQGLEACGEKARHVGGAVRIGRGQPQIRGQGLRIDLCGCSRERPRGQAAEAYHDSGLPFQPAGPQKQRPEPDHFA